MFCDLFYYIICKESVYILWSMIVSSLDGQDLLIVTSHDTTQHTYIINCVFVLCLGLLWLYNQFTMDRINGERHSTDRWPSGVIDWEE